MSRAARRLGRREVPSIIPARAPPSAPERASDRIRLALNVRIPRRRCAAPAARQAAQLDRRRGRRRAGAAPARRARRRTGPGGQALGGVAARRPRLEGARAGARAARPGAPVARSRPAATARRRRRAAVRDIVLLRARMPARRTARDGLRHRPAPSRAGAQPAAPARRACAGGAVAARLPLPRHRRPAAAGLDWPGGGAGRAGRGAAAARGARRRAGVLRRAVPVRARPLRRTEQGLAGLSRTRPPPRSRWRAHAGLPGAGGRTGGGAGRLSGQHRARRRGARRIRRAARPGLARRRQRHRPRPHRRRRRRTADQRARSDRRRALGAVGADGARAAARPHELAGGGRGAGEGTVDARRRDAHERADGGAPHSPAAGGSSDAFR